jgi:hypothetical protein
MASRIDPSGRPKDVIQIDYRVSNGPNRNIPLTPRANIHVFGFATFANFKPMSSLGFNSQIRPRKLNIQRTNFFSMRIFSAHLKILPFVI